MADDSISPLSSGINKGVQNAIVDLVERVYKHGSAKSKATVDTLRLKFTTKLTEYLNQTAVRCRKVKTLISRTDPIDIEEAYVAASFRVADSEFSEAELLRRACAGEQIIISGIAGSGKSMTMRYLYLQLCKSQGNLIPVFLELRHVGFRGGQDVIGYVIDQIANFTHSIERQAFLSVLKERRVVFLLDGFDEIAIEVRERAEKDILEIARSYPLCPILVSSRPDSRFQRWHSFIEAKVCPLSIEQVEELIAKTKYNEPTKINFMRRIKEGLFSSHKELLSNPLLATMMLMTFEEFAEIPSKMHIFYRSAFEVLFRRHDATKVDFHREFKTELSIDDFERIFATFCLMSYLDSVHSFEDEASIMKYIEKAIQYEGVKALSRDLKDDLVDNICIVLHDGEQFAFLHRSFQEYFSAVFLANRSVEAFEDVVEATARKDFGLAVVKFLFEMNREVLERGYLIPRVEKVIADLDKLRVRGPIRGVALTKKGLGLFVNSIMFGIPDGDTSFSIAVGRPPRHFPVLNMLNSLYMMGLFPSQDATSAAVSDAEKKGHVMGAGRDAKRVSLSVDKISAIIVSGAKLDKYLERTLSRLRDFLEQKTKEEAERKILLSEALLSSRKKLA